MNMTCDLVWKSLLCYICLLKTQDTKAQRTHREGRTVEDRSRGWSWATRNTLGSEASKNVKFTHTFVQGLCPQNG